MESFENGPSKENPSGSGDVQAEGSGRSLDEIMKHNADVMTEKRPIYATEDELKQVQERLDTERELKKKNAAESGNTETPEDIERRKAEEKLQEEFRKNIYNSGEVTGTEEDGETEEKDPEEYVPEGVAMGSMAGGYEETETEGDKTGKKEGKKTKVERNSEALKVAQTIEGRVNSLYECVNAITAGKELSDSQKESLRKEGLSADPNDIKDRIKLLSPDLATAASMAVVRTGIEGHRELAGEERLNFRDIEHNSAALLNGIRGLKEGLEMEILTSEQKRSVQKFSAEEGSNQWSVFSHYKKDSVKRSGGERKDDEHVNSGGEYKITSGQAEIFWNLLFKQNDEKNRRTALKVLCRTVGRDATEMMNSSDLRLDSGQDTSGKIYLNVVWKDADSGEKKLTFSVDMHGYKPGPLGRNFGFIRNHTADIAVNDYAEKTEGREDQEEGSPEREEGGPEVNTAGPDTGGNNGEGDTASGEDKENPERGGSEGDNEMQDRYVLTLKYFKLCRNTPDMDQAVIGRIDKAESALLKGDTEEASSFIAEVIADHKKAMEKDGSESMKQMMQYLEDIRSELEAKNERETGGKPDKENSQRKDAEVGRDIEENYPETVKLFDILQSLGETAHLDEILKALKEGNKAGALAALDAVIKRANGFLENKNGNLGESDKAALDLIVFSAQKSITELNSRENGKNEAGEGFIKLDEKKRQDVESAKLFIIENRGAQFSRGKQNMQGMLDLIKENTGIDADGYDKEIKSSRADEDRAFILQFEKGKDIVRVKVDISRLEDGMIQIAREGGEDKKADPEFSNMEVKHFKAAQEYEVDDDTLKKIQPLGYEKSSLEDSQAVIALLKAIDYKTQSEIRPDTGVVVSKMSSGNGKISVSAKLLYGGSEEPVDFIIDLNSSQATKKIKIEHLAKA